MYSFYKEHELAQNILASNLILFFKDNLGFIILSLYHKSNGIVFFYNELIE